MKLRNKKTGKIFDWQEGDMPFGLGLPHPKTLAELNEEWEDYGPAEPLIKDEKIRKVVREWAKLNNSYWLHQHNNYQLEDDNNYMIEFAGDCFTNLELGKNYTIDELCGEDNDD